MMSKEEVNSNSWRCINLTLTIETATFILHVFVEDIYIFSVETGHVMFVEWLVYKRRKIRRAFRTLNHISLGSVGIWFLLQFLTLSYKVRFNLTGPVKRILTSFYTQVFQSFPPKSLLTSPISLSQCRQSYLLVTKCWVPHGKNNFI